MTTAKRRGLRDSQIGLILIFPAAVIFCIIILYPLINAVFMSFTDRSLIKPATAFTGIENYIKLFKDNNFSGLLINTFIFVFFSTVLSFILGFIWAVVLNTKFRFAELFRGISLVNWIFPGVAIGYLWIWMFHGEYGLVNGLLRLFGITDKNINWPGQMNTAMMVVIIARVWSMMPFNMAFILGGLQGVSADQVEAARIDGAGNICTFLYIVLPEMKSIISLILILGSISNLQSFDLIYVMTAGGPARATTTFSIEVYRNAFKFYNLGYASAIGVIWALLLGIVSILYIRQIRENEA
jgi:multiple sugar transport system permease protein